jgi:hypothetical protein
MFGFCLTREGREKINCISFGFRAYIKQSNSNNAPKRFVFFARFLVYESSSFWHKANECTQIGKGFVAIEVVGSAPNEPIRSSMKEWELEVWDLLIGDDDD